MVCERNILMITYDYDIMPKNHEFLLKNANYAVRERERGGCTLSATLIMMLSSSQHAGMILTQNNCHLKNFFRIHFQDAYGVPGQAK